MVGGRKKRRKLDQSTDVKDWEGRVDKVEASLVFKEVWEKAKNWEGYRRRKEEFLKKQKGRSREQKLVDGSAKDAKKRRKRQHEPDDDTID